MKEIKKRWVVLSLFVLMMGGCFWERVASEFVFQYHCHKSAGIFIYENIHLSKDYLIPVDDARKLKGASEGYFLDNEWAVDHRLLLKEYDIESLNKSEVSTIGPVNYVRTGITRKKDGKVMAEIISVINYMGWNHSGIVQVLPRKDCVDSNNKGKRLLLAAHYSLVKKTLKIDELFN